MTKRRKRIFITLTAIFIIVIGSRWGCNSTSLPPLLTSSQHSLIDTVRFEASVGVAVYRFPVYSEKLIKSLKATGLFTRIDKLDNFMVPPTFIARVARPIYGTATIPIFTGISLGVIPTVVDEEHGHAFWIIPYQHPSDSVLIDFSYTGPTTLGWACIYLNFKSDRACGDVYTHQQFYDGFSYTIAGKASKIRQLNVGSQ